MNTGETDRTECKAAVTVPLGHGRFAIIDACDLDIVSRHSWHLHDGDHRKTPYARTDVVVNGRRAAPLLHKFLWAHWGFAPCGLDHQNTNGLDCRRENIRRATHAQNQANRGLSCTNTSGFKGVTFHRKSNKWRAMIMRDGKLASLGLFSTPELASAAYSSAAKEIFGEFARIA